MGERAPAPFDGRPAFRAFRGDHTAPSRQPATAGTDCGVAVTTSGHAGAGQNATALEAPPSCAILTVYPRHRASGTGRGRGVLRETGHVCAWHYAALHGRAGPLPLISHGGGPICRGGAEGVQRLPGARSNTLGRNDVAGGWGVSSAVPAHAPHARISQPQRLVSCRYISTNQRPSSCHTLSPHPQLAWQAATSWPTTE